MAAPKENKFWELRSKHGRDKLFASPKLMWEAACQYFQWCEENPFYELEQRRGMVKPYKDDKGNVTWPDEFVKIPQMRPFTLQGLCRYIECNIRYFDHFQRDIEDKEDQQSKDFNTVITRIREVIYDQKFSGAAAGFFNANIIARDLGLTDRKDITSEDERIEFNVKVQNMPTEELIARANAIHELDLAQNKNKD